MVEPVNILKIFIKKKIINYTIKLFYKGVGKSFLIECIRDSLNILYQNTDNLIVATLAPTGIAANNINGVTIHKFFKLIVMQNKQVKFFNLTKSAIKNFRSIYKNLALIIIGKYINNN